MRNKPVDKGFICKCGKELFGFNYRVHDCPYKKPVPAPQKCGVADCQQPEAAIGLCEVHLNQMAWDYGY